MNRNAGMSAGILALLALVFHVSAPTGSEKDAGQAGKQDTGKAGAKRDSQSKDAACRPDDCAEGPWLATRAVFGAKGSHKTPRLKLNNPINLESVNDTVECAADDSCRPQWRAFFGLSDGYDVEFLLATIPDPLHTRLSLFTDSSIQAIQQAASAAGWTFATQWLPWSDNVDSDEKDPVKRREEREEIRRREKEPGLLVFRHGVKEGHGFSNRVLMVFLVGETPTAGLVPAQFQVARAYMRSLERKGKAVVRVQGPTFSGSLYSLAKLIQEEKKESRSEKVSLKYYVRSGTATSVPDQAAFIKDTQADFFSATANSTDQNAGLLKALKKLAIPIKKAALITEDETSFGDSQQSAAAREPANEKQNENREELRVFRYPRDISHLRNAYREVVQLSKSERVPSPDLSFSLKDETSGEDSVPTFSVAQTPLIQSAVMSEMTGEIRRGGFRAVEVSATNVLDLLFLAQLLRRQCPDTRVIISNASLLFTEATRTESLSGMLALSPYPLMGANDRLVPSRSTSIHGDSDSEGVYNATLLLLAKSAGNEDPALVKLADFRWNPPLWLLTFDGLGFLPIRAFEREGEFFAEGPAGKAELRLPSPPRIWWFLAGLLETIGIVTAALVLNLQFDKSSNIAARMEMFRPDSDDQRRRFYLLSFLLCIASVQLLIWLPNWHHESEVLSGSLVEPILFGAGILAPIGLALVLFARSIWQADWRGRAALAGLILIWLMALGLWIYCCFGPEESAFFFRFRALELRLGSSPIWPVATALTALLVGSFAHLTRVYYADAQHPSVAVQVETALQKRLQLAYGQFSACARSMTGIIGVRQKCWAAGALALSLGIFLYCGGSTAVRGIDGVAFDVLSAGLQLAVLFGVLATCWQITALWYWLQMFLSALNKSPLSRAFIPPRAIGETSPIWVRRVNLQSLDVHVRAAVIAHDMALSTSNGKADQVIASLTSRCYRRSRAIRSVLKPTDGVTRRRLQLEHAVLSKISKDFAGEFHDKILLPRWKNDALVSRWRCELKADGGGELGGAEDGRGYWGIRGDPKELNDLAEAFVALHYTSFLLYGVRQIQNLVWFPSIGLVLLMMSLNSYSYQAPQTIGRFLLVLSLAAGAVLWKCLSAMERDPILSKIAGTRPGKLNAEFYFKFAGYGALPVLGLLSSEFPSISGFLFSWVEPTLEAMK